MVRRIDTNGLIIMNTLINWGLILFTVILEYLQPWRWLGIFFIFLLSICKIPAYATISHIWYYCGTIICYWLRDLLGKYGWMKNTKWQTQIANSVCSFCSWYRQTTHTIYYGGKKSEVPRFPLYWCYIFIGLKAGLGFNTAESRSVEGASVPPLVCFIKEKQYILVMEVILQYVIHGLLIPFYCFLYNSQQIFHKAT